MVVRAGGAGSDNELAAGLPVALSLTLGYGLVHASIRYLSSGNLGEDDPPAVIDAQVLAVGYRPDHPPLYEWLLFVLQRLLGFDVLPHLVLKYGLLLVLGGFIFLIAKRVTGSGMWALVAVESLTLIYSLSWRMHEAFTSQMIGMAAAAATTYWLIRCLDPIDRRPAAGPWLFGLAAGLGLLSGWPFLVMLASLLIAAVLQLELRRRLLVPVMLIAPAAALAVVAPFAWWVLSAPGRLASLVNSLVMSHSLPDIVMGIGYALGQPAAYLFPLIAIVPLVFWGWHRVALEQALELPADASGDRLARLIRDQALAAIAALVVGALVLGAAGYPVHAIAPMFIVTPVWLIAVAARVPDARRRRRWFAGLAAAVAVVALSARLLNLFALDPHCGICRWGIPYDRLAAAIQQDGFTDGTIVGADADLIANLRRYFPAARLQVAAPASGVDRPSVGRSSPTLYVWETTVPAGRQKVKYPGLRPALPDPALERRAIEVAVPWRHLWRPLGYRQSRFRYLIVPAAG